MTVKVPPFYILLQHQILHHLCFSIKGKPFDRTTLAVRAGLGHRADYVIVGVGVRIDLQGLGFEFKDDLGLILKKC